MSLSGGCHCGAVRYEVQGEPQHVSVCHCSDCRKSAGAPFVSWAAFKTSELQIKGEVTAYHSTGSAVRHFCPRCGTGIYYVNEDVLPGLIDIQTCTLDDPEALEPQLHVQGAEQLHWTKNIEDRPKFERYPG